MLADPPYNVGKKYGTGTNDKRPDKEYWAWYKEVFAMVAPKMTASALLYVSSTSAQVYKLRPLMRRLGLTWVQNLVWYRPNMICGAKMFAAPWSQLHEPIGLFRKGKRAPMLNPGWAVEDCKSHDVLIFSSPQSNFAESVDHPCQKPIKLYKNLIARSPGAVLLDPFSGSGTSLEVAKILGRRAIGIEIEEKFCEVTAKRLAQEMLTLA